MHALANDVDRGDAVAAPQIAVTWPPPGLEKLHGGLRVVHSRAIIALIAIAPVFAWLMLGVPILDGTTRFAIGLTVAFGLLALLSAILNAARVVDYIRTFAKLGYSRMLLLEVALDHGTDTLALVAGTGM